ncbi:MAG: Ig-like domain repeat protein [Propionibacteriaceae bacterium]|nr:Ig-like domain repeat protein [Propionibacteriaceae bacterium]
MAADVLTDTQLTIGHFTEALADGECALRGGVYLCEATANIGDQVESAPAGARVSRGGNADGVYASGVDFTWDGGDDVAGVYYKFTVADGVRTLVKLDHAGHVRIKEGSFYRVRFEADKGGQSDFVVTGDVAGVEGDACARDASEAYVCWVEDGKSLEATVSPADGSYLSALSGLDVDWSGLAADGSYAVSLAPDADQTIGVVALPVPSADDAVEFSFVDGDAGDPLVLADLDLAGNCEMVPADSGVYKCSAGERKIVSATEGEFVARSDDGRGVFSEAVDFGDGSVKGSYFGQTVENGVRTLARYAAVDDFMVRVGVFHTVAIGSASDEGYTAVEVREDGDPENCADKWHDQALLYCLVEDGHDLEVSVSPDAGRYLSRVSVDGVDQVLGFEDFALSLDGVSADVAVSVVALKPVDIPQRGDLLLDADASVGLFCSTGGSWEACTPTDGVFGADSQMVSVTGSDGGWVFWPSALAAGLSWRLQASGAEVSGELYSGFADGLAVDDAVSEVFARSVDGNVVTVSRVVFDRPVRVRVDGAEPVVDGPGLSPLPVVDGGKSVWTVSVTASDSDSGLRGVVWARVPYPSVSGARSVLAGGETDPLGGAGVCERLDGEWLCRVGAEGAGPEPFEVKFFAVDMAGNVASSGVLSLLLDTVGPVVADGYSVVDAASGVVLDSGFCSAAVDVVVYVSDAGVGLSAASARSDLGVDAVERYSEDGALLAAGGAPDGPSRGVVALRLPAGDADHPASTRVCGVDGGGDGCQANWDAANQRWQVVFRDVPSSAVAGSPGVWLSGQLSVDAWDVYGNRGSAVLSQRLEIENVFPTASLTTGSGSWLDPDTGRLWFAGSDAASRVGFGAVVADCLSWDEASLECRDGVAQSGMGSWSARVGSASGGVLGAGSVSLSGSPGGALVERVPGDGLASAAASGCQADGECRLEVEVSDRAGSSSGVVGRSVWLDRLAPVVSSISFKADSKTDADSSVGGVAPSPAVGYGHFATDSVRVTVAVSDPGASAGSGSGVGVVELWLAPADGGEARLVGSRQASSQGKASFAVSGDFRGAVYARVADRAGNRSGEVYAASLLSLESDAAYAAQSHVSSDAAKVVRAQAVGLDAADRPLFAGSVKVALRVENVWAGIAEVGCSYTTEERPKAKSCAPGLSGWRQTHGDPADEAAVTSASYTLTIADDSNNIVVDWWVKDRAGRVTRASRDAVADQASGSRDERLRLSVDKTRPKVVSVAWSGGRPDPDHPTVHSAARSVAITVKERNFAKASAVLSTGGEASGWKRVGKASDWTYRAVVDYDKDGEYLAADETLRVTDLAGRKLAETLELPSWTLDTTPPVIAVSWSGGGEPGPGGVYPQARTATLTVVDANFDPSRVRLADPAAELGGEPVAGFSWDLSWAQAGPDRHAASISFDSDGRYGFAATVADAAGNDGAPLDGQAFWVDRTAPRISIERAPGGGALADGSAFGDQAAVAPVVEVWDDLWEAGDGAGQAAVELESADGLPHAFGQPAASQSASGAVWRYQALPDSRANDGVYTLTVEATDPAGHTARQTAAFMVDRHGSVYQFDSATLAMAESAVPLQEASAVVVTEYNPTPVAAREVKIVRDGQHTDVLEQGADGYLLSAQVVHGWRAYTYTIPAARFAQEGSYQVRLWSRDEAGNASSNDVTPTATASGAADVNCGVETGEPPRDCSPGAEIAFRVDKTPPTLTAYGVEDHGRYQQAALQASVEAADYFDDNIASLQVEIDGQPVETQPDGQSRWTFQVPSGFLPHNIQIRAEDKAGRHATLYITDVLVNNNPAAIWFNNTPLFATTTIGAALLASAATLAINRRKLKQAARKANYT